MSRAINPGLLNLPGQAFRTYVAFGNEIRIAVDGNMQSPPPTVYPENLHMVPFRPTAVMGPHRILEIFLPIKTNKVRRGEAPSNLPLLV